MSTGEVTALNKEATAVPVNEKLENQAKFVAENAEMQISVSEKFDLNLRVEERFSRLRKSLRKKSVSIF